MKFHACAPARLRAVTGGALALIVFFGAAARADYGAVPVPEKHMVEPGQEVHQWITQEAWRYFNSQIAGAELSRHIGIWGVDGVYDDLRQATVIDGARDEDKGHKPPLWQGSGEGGFDLDAPVLRHFCASAKQIYVGYYLSQQYDSNLTQAERIWQGNAADNMLLRHGRGEKTTAYYYLGHVVHLIQDMTVPAHTHNDPHGSTLVSLHDSYEQDYAATHFREFHFDDTAGGEYILKSTPITVPATLLEAFQQTAEYTDDYDSNHADGEFVTGGMGACYFPTDFPSALLHRPGDAFRTGGGSASTMTDESCAIVANDLMYWSMKRTAQLYRLFYRTVDSSPFHASIRLADQNLPLSADESGAVPYFGPASAVLHVAYDTATTGDFPPSGIVMSSCVLHCDFKPDGGDWQGEQTFAFPGGAGTVPVPTQPEGICKVWVSAENGAGNQADPVPGYFRTRAFGLALAPRGGRIEFGTPLRLSVLVNGASDAATYQWEKDGQPIPGADSDTYSVPSAAYSDAGQYRCTVTDPAHGTIVTPWAGVEVLAQGTLPAAGGLGLVLAAVAMLGLAARALSGRRRCQHARGRAA